MKASEIYKRLIVLNLCLLVAVVQGHSLFTDKTSELGLDLSSARVYHGRWISFSPVACIDYNADGWVDLYTDGVLWQNNEGKSFSKVIEKSGPGVWADFDNDGYSDLFCYKSQKLFRNSQGKDLEEWAFPELVKQNSCGASWADHNGDGYVDLYIGAWGESENGCPDVRLTNVPELEHRKSRRLRLVWEQSQDDKMRTRGITSCDFDEDGDVDIYVCNYRVSPNTLLQNDGKGNFKDIAAEYGVAGDPDTWADLIEYYEVWSKTAWLKKEIQEYSKRQGWGNISLWKDRIDDFKRHLQNNPDIDEDDLIEWSYGHTEGAAWGDLDNDGYFDLFVGNFSHLRPEQDRPKFYRNMGPSGNYHFQDKSDTAGLAWQESYASPSLGDYDNDGDLDLYYTTQYAEDLLSLDIKNYPVLYRNDGNWHFTDVTEKEGLSKLGPTHQAAWADLDNDGDLDLITEGRIFINQGNSNHWLKVHLEGDGDKVNRDAVGAQVRIHLNDKIIARQVEAGTGLGNQNELTLHFGLGSYEGPVDLEIFWPTGTKQIIRKVKVDQLIKRPHFREL